ncbi:MAG: hypothetical protein JWQ71_1046 [Pedosphaera sp.]|nr:hypothetical protein [Pedosphaera sp.]
MIFNLMNRQHILAILFICLLLLGTNSQATTKYVNVNNPTPSSPYTTWATAATNIQTAVDSAFAGDLILVTNGVYQIGGRAAYGMSNRVAVTSPMTLLSVNGPAVTTIAGKTVFGTTTGFTAMRCVYLTNGAVLSGFTLTNGATQSSGDALHVQVGGGVWCESSSAMVSNCIITGNFAQSGGGGAYSGTLNNCTLSGNKAQYGAGAESGTLSNCTLTGNSAQYGGGANAGTLTNCTLSGNKASDSGGGTYFATLNNCILSGNSAYYGGGAKSGTLSNCTFNSNLGYYGGGVEGSTLINCTLSSNLATNGGGTYLGTLTNCTLTGNSASYGGGTLDGLLINCTLTGNSASTNGGGVYFSEGYDVSLNNCILYYNSAPTNANFNPSRLRYLSYCCAMPLPPNGEGNFTNAPLFVNQAGGDLHLQANSPCINSGLNTYVQGATDLDSNPRIRGGTVDVGAYEFPNPTSVISYAWLQQFGLSIDGSTDFTDADIDGRNNWQEWVSGTNPTDANSSLRVLTLTTGYYGITVGWNSVARRNYYLERATDLSSPSPFQLVKSNLFGQAGMTFYTDTGATNSGPFFYRVGIQ